MIRNLKLSKKLTLGFGSLFAVMGLMALLFMIALGVITSKINFIEERSVPVVNATWQGRRNMVEVKASFYQSLAGASKQERMKHIDEGNKELDNLMGEVVPILEEKYYGDATHLQQFESIMSNTEQAKEKFIKALETGQVSEAEVALGTYMTIFAEAGGLLVEMNEGAIQRIEGRIKDVELISRIMFIGVVIMLVAAGLFVIKLSKKIIKSINDPVNEIEIAAKALSQGQLSDAVVTYEADDELGSLANSMRTTIKALQTYIQDISAQLTYMAKGDMSKNIELEYMGEFEPIKTALNNISDQLNHTLKNINQSAEEVSSGSEDIAKGATELAQGATEQASIIEEFIASTEEIAQNISGTVEKVNKTSQISQEARERANQGAQVMEKMLVSMNDISESSKHIAQVLKTIDSIASQTNLLALNAAIESARAGEAGKGFAVVANEIRDLANRSSDTVKEIENMLKISVQNVETGQAMADQAAQVLKEIVGSVEKTTEIASELLEGSTQQKESIEELTKGTQQIAAVVEVNASTSQESAAVSEELAAQAENLKSLIQYFHLKG